MRLLKTTEERAALEALVKAVRRWMIFDEMPPSMQTAYLRACVALGMRSTKAVK